MGVPDQNDDDVDWLPIYISGTIILLSALFLYHKTITEILNAAKIAIEFGLGFISNRYALYHLLFGWPKYLFAIKNEYGYGSSTKASEIVLNNTANLFNKTIIVTGGNSGVGLAMCEALSAVSHNQSEAIDSSNNDTQCCIIMASRNKTKSEKVIKQILKQYPKADIQFIPLDLSNAQSIVTFVNSLKRLPKQAQIRILINNAGVSMVLNGESIKFDNNLDQRFEKTFAINYLGPFVLTQLIFETYFKNNDKECRIVNQSSIFHTVASAFGEEDMLNIERFRKYHLDKKYNHTWSYGVSKLFQIIHVKMMMDEYKKWNVLFNCCHPGISLDTQMVAQPFSESNTFILRIVSTLFSFVSKTNNQMGASAMVLACEKRMSATGQYFQDCGVKQLNQACSYVGNARLRDILKKYSFSIYNNIKQE